MLAGSARNIRGTIMIAVKPKERDPLLLPDRDEPYCLHDVHEKVVHGLREEIVLDFGDSSVTFVAEPDYDTIGCRFRNQPFVSNRGYRRVGAESPWSRLVDKACGWTWLAVNQQGYWDTALISFDAVVPNVLLNVMASSLYVFEVKECATKQNASKPRSSKKNGR
jgi:Family of unknown function (DUF6334)